MNKTVKYILLAQAGLSLLFTLSIIGLIFFGIFSHRHYFNVGDIGPAGGIIFYVNNQKSDGWTYLEVAPAEYEFSAPWGLYGTAVPESGTDVGSGKKNTDIMVSLTRVEGRDSAAYKCRQLEINGFNDWFLPSKDELSLIYTTLYSEGIGSFKDDWYWSSSVWNEDDDLEWNSKYYSWVHDFSNGKQITYASDGSRTFVGLVRAIRAF